MCYEWGIARQKPVVAEILSNSHNLYLKMKNLYISSCMCIIDIIIIIIINVERKNNYVLT